MTPIRWQRCATTARLWLTRMVAIPRSPCRLASRLSTSAWTDTSSALVGSSSSSSGRLRHQARGRSPRAAAGRPRVGAGNGTARRRGSATSSSARQDARRRLPAEPAHGQRFGQGPVHRLPGVQRAVRVLEHHLHLAGSRPGRGVGPASTPSIATSRPVQSGLRPAMARRMVDLPEPLSPTRPNAAAGRHLPKLMPCTISARPSQTRTVHGRRSRLVRPARGSRASVGSVAQRSCQRRHAAQQPLACRGAVARGKVARRRVPPPRARRYITATRSQKWPTIGRSWLISSSPMPRRATRSSINRRMSACTVASSALVGSSAMSSSGIRRQHHRDHDPLPHAAGQLVRVQARDTCAGSRMRTWASRSTAAARACLLAAALVRPPRLRHLVARGHDRD